MPDNGIKKKLELGEIVPSDLGELARFIGRVSGSKVPLPEAIKRLSWILLENPARESGSPLGWLLRNSTGEVVGCMCSSPQKFCLGSETFTLVMANSFYVDDQYRGAGSSIFLKFLQLGRRYPLFVSSANATVAEMWQRLGGVPVGNSDHEVFRVRHWRPLLAESVYRKTASDRIAQIVASIASPWFRVGKNWIPRDAGGELLRIKSAEEAASICAGHRSDKLTNCRDAAFLKWRYFSSADPATRLFAFRSRDEGNKQFVIGVRMQHRGYKQQIRALHVLDIWGEPGPRLCLAIADSLEREYYEQIDMLVFRCLDPEQQEALTAHGFRVRSFAAPIAWCIDKIGLLPATPWYFVPADGDMFL